jgi:hypothetical protein
MWRSDSRATTVDFVADTMVVRLEDGRLLSVPLEWFPRLRDAMDARRRAWEILGPGIGIHWPDIDEDISVAGLLGVPD